MKCHAHEAGKEAAVKVSCACKQMHKKFSTFKCDKGSAAPATPMHATLTIVIFFNKLVFPFNYLFSSAVDTSSCAMYVTYFYKHSLRPHVYLLASVVRADTLPNSCQAVVCTGS